MGLGVVGVDANGLAEGVDRLLELAVGPEHISEIVMSLRKVGLNADGLATGGDRLFEFALSPERGPKVGKVGRVASIPFDGPPNQFDGYFRAPKLVSDQPQQMQGVGMIRLYGQYLPVIGLGFDELAGLLAGEPGLKQVSNESASRCDISVCGYAMIARSRPKLGVGASLAAVHKGSPRR